MGLDTHLSTGEVRNAASYGQEAMQKFAAVADKKDSFLEKIIEYGGEIVDFIENLFTKNPKTTFKVTR